MFTTMTTQLPKDKPCEEYIGKPVVNGLGETVGKIVMAAELDDCIEVTMEIEIPVPWAKPLMRSFELGGK